MTMLEEAKGLFDLGFALHWLHPKSKRPVEMGWTKGPRKTWEMLKSSFRPGYNVGVRLGQASKVEGGYLCVIDCDVKSTDVVHLEKMMDRFHEFGFIQGPRVLSGRGNGSRHVYAISLEPLTPRRLAQSPEKVRVLMPSVRATPKEINSLSPEEIRRGVRLRPAWEISLMGEGQQVVLPPSIHPDTGKKYVWKEELGKVNLPLIADVEKIEGETEVPKPNAPGQTEFIPVSVDLVGSELPDPVVDLILSGKNCEDRSASLLGAAIAMVRGGLSDQEILSVLTDSTNYLGRCAFDHTKSKNRARAAAWVEKYTLRRARREAGSQEDFALPVENTILSEEAAKLQAEELEKSKHWTTRLEKAGPRGDERPRPILKNIMLILENAFEAPVFLRNDFTNRIVYGLDAPWGRIVGSEIGDIDPIHVKCWLSEHYRFEPPTDRIWDAIFKLADKNHFHPVHDYLERIEWDGKDRLDSWLKRYLNADEEEPYLSEVSRKVLCAMVARVLEPGVKFDHILILEGNQGVGKSSAARILAGEWFCDTVIDVKDKDAMLNLQGAWIVEISELAVLKRSESETYKSFFTRQIDRLRVPYGRAWQEFKRQCVFIGTTNLDNYLADKSGNRRFWPVKVGQCDFKALTRDRDQLLAEAKWVWENLREDLFLTKAASRKQAEELQASRVGVDEENFMLDHFLDFLELDSTKPEAEKFNWRRFKLADLFQPGGAFQQWKSEKHKIMLAANILKKNGFEGFYSQGRRFWRKGRYL